MCGTRGSVSKFDALQTLFYVNQCYACKAKMGRGAHHYTKSHEDMTCSSPGLRLASKQTRILTGKKIRREKKEEKHLGLLPLYDKAIQIPPRALFVIVDLYTSHPTVYTVCKSHQCSSSSSTTTSTSTPPTHAIHPSIHPAHSSMTNVSTTTTAAQLLDMPCPPQEVRPHKTTVQRLRRPGDHLPLQRGPPRVDGRRREAE